MYCVWKRKGYGSYECIVYGKGKDIDHMNVMYIKMGNNMDHMNILY